MLKPTQDKMPIKKSNSCLTFILYGIGLMDLVGSIFLLKYTSTIPDEDFANKLEIAKSVKLPSAISYLLHTPDRGLHSYDILPTEEVENMRIVFEARYLQMKYRFLLAVALCGFVLSCVLIFGLYKKYSSFCAFWHDCNSVAVVIYMLIVLFVIYFDCRPFRIDELVLICGYLFYRIFGILLCAIVGSDFTNYLEKIDKLNGIV